MSNYKADLKVYQQSLEIILLIQSTFAFLQGFPHNFDFSLSKRMRRKVL